MVTDNLTSVARVLNQRLDSMEGDEHRAEKSVGKSIKNVEVNNQSQVVPS